MNALEADRARALDEHASPALEQLARAARRRASGVGDPRVGRVVAGELADADQRLDPELAGVRAGLAVVGRAVGAELGHAAEDGDPAPCDGSATARWSSAARIEIGLAL